MIKASAQLAKGGACPNFTYFCYADFTILATPLNTPLDVSILTNKLSRQIIECKIIDYSQTSPVTIVANKKNRTKGVEMPFMMSVALQVATKLFDQQAAEPPMLFCNLMRIL